MAGGIATLGAVIALVAIFQPQPETLESRTRKRLLRVAQAALDLSAAANSDQEFVEAFDDWQTEANALRDFILAHYGLRERVQFGRELYRRDEAAEFAAVMRERLPGSSSMVEWNCLL
ncbi:MAG TPA: hypothetical protein VLC46_00540 [Thermoanaerobaculia bacterium]|nr:hypothetical protein [Thermoanaerobaculia bacterium]